MSPQKRCCGLTKNLCRCGRIGNWRFFCDEHSRQPLVWLFVVIFTVAGGAASILGYLSSISNQRIQSTSDKQPPLPSDKFTTPHETPVPPSPPLETKKNPRDGLTYVGILPGTFLMGCSQNDHECDRGGDEDDQDRRDESPRHLVEITKGFWLSQTSGDPVGLPPGRQTYEPESR